MRIAQINLPLEGNAGESLRDQHKALGAWLAKTFGGYTALDGQGGWVSPSGETMIEPVTVYSVAYDPNEWRDVRPEIIGIANWIGIEAGQEAMFIVVDGEAEILECS